MTRAALLSFLLLALAAGVAAAAGAEDPSRAGLASQPPAGKERAPEPEPEKPAPLPPQALLRARFTAVWAAPGRSVREHAERSAHAPAGSPPVPWTVRLPGRIERASGFRSSRLVRFSARQRRSPPGC